MKQDRLLILTEYFYPDMISSGRVMTELAEGLVTAGFSVSVVCGQPSYLAHRGVLSREDWHGISVTRLSELRASRHSGLGRAANWTCFMLQCLFRLPLWRHKYERILVVTNPAPALSIGWLFRLRHSAQFVAVVHDVFPENAIAIGRLREHSLVARAMSSLNRVSLHSADVVVILGEDMKRLLCSHYGLALDRVRVIPNWAAEADSADTVGADGNWRQTLDLKERFLVLYAGNFGFLQDADRVIACLAACRSMADVLFCFVGAGGEYDRLCREEKNGSIPNLRVVPFQTGTRYASLLKLAGCGLVSLHPRLGGMAVPSKVVGYMAAGVPMICLAGSGSDLADMVEGTGSGIMCQSPEQFADAVRLMASNKQLRAQMAANGRRAAETKYSRSQCIATFAEVLSRPL